MNFDIFNCLLIGEGSLLIECATILIEKKHQIIGILSPDKTVADWAKRYQIDYYKNRRELLTKSTQSRCEYIFSIVNNTILDRKILDLADTAINYHDSLLPTYAGVNATSWAILNGELQHGITWHEIELEIDTGKIFKQVKIKLEPQEIALTLNSKCYQAAIASFKELIVELAAQKVIKTPQNLQQRSYFARHQKPPKLGIIDFNNSATAIDSLVRGLNFGNYPNPLATAKLLLKLNVSLDYVIVNKVKILATASTQLPGTIVGLEKNSLIVATTDRDIAIEAICTKQQQIISIEQLVTNYRLEIGQILPQLAPHSIEEIVELSSAIAPSDAYWLKQLTDARTLNLPSKLNSTALEQNNNYQQVRLPFNSKITNFVADSLEVIITAFALYLSRLSGCDRVTLGLDRSIENLWFARYIPCNFIIPAEANFTNLLKTVSARLKLNHKHQTHTTDIVARYPQLNIEKTDYLVLVKVKSRGWGLQGDELTSPHSPSASLAPLKSQVTNNNSLVGDLILIIDRDRAEYFWSYNTQVFSPQTIERMLEQWMTLLEAIASNSQSPVSQLSFVSPLERQQIDRWNQTQFDYPQDKCLHQLFEARVAQNPEAIAIAYRGQYLTYRELEQKANRLASHLRHLGVTAETLVGICVERSLEMVIGLFAILKAGGAYLPLDPNYPQARLTYLLEDARVDILLTQEKLLACLPQTSAKIVCLDRDWETIDCKKSDFINNVNSDNLAYTIYTSGSTGNPKGVAIEHRSAVNTLYDIERRFQINSQDRILAVSSLSFDLSVYDIFGILGSGGTVIIPQAETCPNPEHWLESIAKEKVTIWNSAPALMELLVNYVNFSKKQLPPSLRLVMLSGDRISLNLVNHLKTLNPQLQIVSLGGATEASIWSIYYPIDNLPPSAKTIPYGRPLGNQYFYIFDRNLQLAPIGVTGELYIGGVGVARGYLHQEELTQEKFIKAPLIKGGWGDCLYKTGDLGRYLEDGNIEFLGRIDNQVKIHGVRVELGEIETTLLQYEDLRETVISIDCNDLEETTLVAYCVLKPQATATSKQLRDFLKTQLPTYAVPQTFVFLDSLPLTPNGKLDRRALSDTPLDRGSRGDLLPPPDRLEWQLSQIWSNILNVKPIGRDENFFDLGGNSLAALRLFEQIQTVFGQSLPLATLFQAPTIAQLVSLMLDRGWSASWSSLVSIQPHGKQSPFFCVHPIGGNVLSYRTLAEALGKERPFYGLQARGLDGEQMPLTSIDAIAASYLEEIRLIQPHGPYFLGGHSFGGFVAFEMAQQLYRQGETVGVLALFDCLGPNSYDKYPFAQWLSIHLHNLAQLSAREKFAYFSERIEYLLQSKIPWCWQEKYFKSIEFMLSPEQRLISRIENIHFQAKQKYTPTVYPGKLTLFRAQIRQANSYFDPYGGWGGLALGGIDFYEVPGDHHSLLFKPENSKILAEKLKYILDNFIDRSWCDELSQISQTMLVDCLYFDDHNLYKS
jgi:amino acid adenylation domain-containing protein